jgi:general secretion pathway protein C
MLSRVSAFVIWAIVAASAMFWALRFLAQGPSAPASAVPVGLAAQARGNLDRLLGTPAAAEAPIAAAAPQAPSRFRLLGVVAPRVGTPEGQGVAVIAVDDKPPRAFRVGSRVEGDLMLRSVSPRAVSLGTATGQSPLNLQLPPRQVADAARAAPAVPETPSRRPTRRSRVDDVPAPPPEAPDDAPPEEPPESGGGMRPPED